MKSLANIRKTLDQHNQQAEELARLLGMDETQHTSQPAQAMAEAQRLELAGQLALRAEAAQKKINTLIKEPDQLMELLEQAVPENCNDDITLKDVVDRAIPGSSQAILHYHQTVKELHHTLYPGADKQSAKKASSRKVKRSGKNFL
ncbi:hypothetical protein [Parendozoicomonas haliclonae]|uniref:Uncharacterized protein n=1 Tax=Parendozoicomonas haliclonae TaxID=1960125 RepID=A0A1X7AMY9_9GAMM|nr:hypothetical protein [Parendozoicomonas haliclonae]SMA49454.1 hypothetical protein EHSB41UT_03272 [Parendozoicomonas haliclonae]